jgi:imidazoleglycerol-phosphate dehydratase / histidinol-phosphatase
MLAPPFTSLTAYGDGLRDWPGPPARLRARMAAVYGVAEAQLLPTRGALHAIELVFRRAARRGDATIAVRPDAAMERLAAIYGVRLADREGGAGAVIVASPADDGSGCLGADEALALAGRIAPALLVVDESLVEFEDAASLAGLVADAPNMVVVRSLSFAYAVAGARCGALIAQSALIAELEALVEPFALPTPTVTIAETVLAPSRVLATEARIAATKAERTRTLEALARPEVIHAAGAGPFIVIEPHDAQAARAGLARLGVASEWLGDGRVRIVVADRAANDRLLAAFGAAPPARPARRAEKVRDTKETKIAVVVDLDATGPVTARTGLGFYDHMLEQVAVHGGFGLQLACEGDLHIDAHHVIEDCALALGAAISDALGERRGIGRFGFVLPMDDAEAKVSVDLGGRPYASFDGSFAAARLGDYPTQLTAHVFRSLAEGMRAAIHVEVAGDDDHHKTEACFKALGRALRQAIRVEGDAIPSSKGVL